MRKRLRGGFEPYRNGHQKGASILFFDSPLIAKIGYSCQNRVVDAALFLVHLILAEVARWLKPEVFQYYYLKEQTNMSVIFSIFPLIRTKHAGFQNQT